jgi:hypothetical protein
MVFNTYTPVIALITLFLLVFWGSKRILELLYRTPTQSRLKKFFERDIGERDEPLKPQKQTLILPDKHASQRFFYQYWQRYQHIYRQKSLLKELPDALDLLCVCMEAGLAMDAALVKVAQEMQHHKSPLGEELEYLSISLLAGLSKETALRQFAQKTGGAEIHTLVSMLIQAERFGTSIMLSLRVHADMMREQRRLKSQEDASKIGLKLLLPLVFCHLPALFIVLLGPACIQLYRTLSPLLVSAMD